MPKPDEMFDGLEDEEKQELWETLDAVVAPLDYVGKFSVVTISSASLEARAFDTLSVKGSVRLGDWTGLAALLNEEEASPPEEFKQQRRMPPAAHAGDLRSKITPPTL